MRKIDSSEEAWSAIRMFACWRMERRLTDKARFIYSSAKCFVQHDSELFYMSLFLTELELLYSDACLLSTGAGHRVLLAGSGNLSAS